MSDPLRIGTLGAARITPLALVRPARRTGSARVVAVAARERSRAERFAGKHGIPRVHDSYDDVLADPEVEAVYVPLPNSHHAEWTIRALRAGKHVLCEKPFAANADEARQMADAAREAGHVLMEAFHWRYHPLASRMKEIVTSGELGTLRRVEASLCLPLVIPGDIRYRLDLAGGALMDVGSYTVSVVRFLVGTEPEVVRADVRLSSPDVDRWATADLRFGDGPRGRVTASLLSADLLRPTARVVGDDGSMWILNPYAPQFGHLLRVRTNRGARWERVRGEPTYDLQLRAFVRAVRDGEPVPTDAEHAVRNMEVIDAIYDRAGLRRRGT